MKFREFSGLRILAWFLEHPTRRIHFKELCRELRLSPATVLSYATEFVAKDWVREERQANLRIFFLSNENPSILALKRAHFLDFLISNGFGKIASDSAISFALYGSYASGANDERSDIDLLVVGRKEDVSDELVRRLEQKSGKGAQVTVIPLERWEKNRKADPFILSVLKNHVLLKGAPL
jgi:hypothetical protein